ncbi:MAG: hypothetical protein ACT4PV_14370 [Planctomycetaceae bacterium]
MSFPRAFARRLREILALPTAPFCEGRVHAAILAAVRSSRRLRAKSDEFGNLLVVFGSIRPRLLFACHTDHPALRAEGDGTAAIVGGIRAAALVGARLRGFEGKGVRGRVVRAVGAKRSARVRIQTSTPCARGEPLLLDLPRPSLGGRFLRAHAVDDLCAVASCLALFDRLEATEFRGCVGALFTRAEEVGFAGALGWVRTTKMPRRTTIVNLEMSSARPHTPQGKGPILRVGDRITTFDPAVTAELEEAAHALQARDASFLWQRALMDGGACEATVYAHAGFRTGALCLPLLNYHNHAPDGGVAREYVHRDDAAGLLRWMEAYARGFPRFDARRTRERRFAALWTKNRARLLASASEGRSRK